MIRGGRSLVTAEPAFSNDSKKLLVCTGSSVSIFSTSTGLQITSLDGHRELITSVVSVPSYSKVICYCWTASLDGTIRYWDYSVPELLKTFDVGSPIFSMVIPSLYCQPIGSNDKLPHIFAYLSVKNLKESNENPKALHGQVIKYNLTMARMAGGVILTKTPKPELITVSRSGKFIGIPNKRKLFIWNVPEEDFERAVVKRIILHHTKKFTVLAFHPTNRIVAAGDSTGRILIWRGFGERTFLDADKMMDGQLMNIADGRPGVRGDDDADCCSTFHWHSRALMLLYFSLDGAYLYSGGGEGVFVLWQLDTGNKKFLPRIGSPLLYYKDSPDPSLSCISCADNQIHFLKMPFLEILKTISGIKLPCSLPEMYGGFYGGIAFAQDSGLVALRTENYRIQFYNLLEDQGIREIQVCERNHQPGDDITIFVILVALSLDGSIMSTVETKLPEEEIGGLICLKFWVLRSPNAEFSLSTVIYEPHREASITAVAFHPNYPMAASSSSGGDFKVWVSNYKSQLENQSCGWTCHAVGSYKKKPLTAVAFSSDGSVLAVAAETVITLWDPHKNVLVAVIGETLMPNVFLSFSGSSNYLVSASRGSKPQLSVWNLSKLSMHWSFKLQSEALACAVDASCFAVLTVFPKSFTRVESNSAKFQGRDGLILLFNVKKPIPVATWSARKASGGQLGFITKNSTSDDERLRQKLPSSQWLVYINGDHEYVIFDPFSESAQEHNVNHPNSSSTFHETEQSGYASIYGDLPVLERRRDEDSGATSDKVWETIFAGSSHNLPPLTKLCASFLESFLEKRAPAIE